MTRSPLALSVAVVIFALAAAGCGGGGGEGSSSTQPDTNAESTAPTETATNGETGDAANGAKVFVSAGCGGCHTLQAAGSSGAVGPNLDDLSPSYDTVVHQVTNGGGGMPSFEDQLSEQEIQDVAAYVSSSTS